MRVVIVSDAFGDGLGAAAAAGAVAAGWRRAAPGDVLTLLPGPHDAPGFVEAVEAALDGAGLAVTGGESFDWRSLRDSLVTAVAGAAVARGVPCVVLAGRVSVGRREAAAVGVDTAYEIADGAGGADDAERSAADALAALAEDVARRWSR